MIQLQFVDRIPSSVNRLNKIYLEQQMEKSVRKNYIAKLVLIYIGAFAFCATLAIIF